MNNTEKKTTIKNPKDTIWGKVLIWTLILMMGLLPVIGFLISLFS